MMRFNHAFGFELLRLVQDLVECRLVCSEERGGTAYRPSSSGMFGDWTSFLAENLGIKNKPSVFFEIRGIEQTLSSA